MTVFNVNSNSDDVEVVMADVAEAVRRWEGGDVMALDLSFVQGRTGQLVEKARRLRMQSQVDGNAIVHSTRPRLGPWIIRFQTLMRRLTWWFTEPILQQVRAFQLNAATVVEGVTENQEALTAELHALVQETGAARIAQLESEVQALRDRLAALEPRPDA